ncbi:MAG TPA: helix-turn-helix transcriptional regulator [Vicinamibacterales bacterium]|jgi:DNA-binding PadR family transcriptional regulator|nr:helix-turn-helix transcriptional regulator [Vicinamibacterales bacterium]
MSKTDLTPKPLKPAAFHILLALGDGQSYGYAMMQAVREQSDGQIPLRTGSFYRHLANLIEAGLIAETAPPRGPVDARRGAYYGLTPRGARALAAEKQRLADLVESLGGLRRASRKGTA